MGNNEKSHNKKNINYGTAQKKFGKLLKSIIFY